MSREVQIDVAEFEAKCKKLVMLLKSGMITEAEYEQYRKKLVEEMRAV